MKTYKDLMNDNKCPPGMKYDKKLKLQNEKPNATTTAVFAMLAIGLSLITFPTMIQKIREMRIVNDVS